METSRSRTCTFIHLILVFIDVSFGIFWEGPRIKIPKISYCR